MRCHYEVLGVPYDATYDDIVKAYHKLALLWHPDKNLDNIERATAEFHCIKEAYNVLSDPDERIFYDRNRPAFLSLDKRPENGVFNKPVTNLYKYLTHTCYDGFGDSPKGFFAVYRRLFDKIIEEEQIWAIQGNPPGTPMPRFGCSISSFEEVVWPFYNFWNKYFKRLGVFPKGSEDITKKTTKYVPFDLQQALAFGMNKQQYYILIKRTQEIMALVNYVKNRDPRLQAEKIRLQNRAKELRRMFEDMRRSPHRYNRVTEEEDDEEPEEDPMIALSMEQEYVEKMLNKQFWRSVKEKDDELKGKVMRVRRGNFYKQQKSKGKGKTKTSQNFNFLRASEWKSTTDSDDKKRTDENFRTSSPGREGLKMTRKEKRQARLNRKNNQENYAESHSTTPNDLDDTDEEPTSRRSPYSGSFSPKSSPSEARRRESWKTPSPRWRCTSRTRSGARDRQHSPISRE